LAKARSVGRGAAIKAEENAKQRKMQEMNLSMRKQYVIGSAIGSRKWWF